MKMNFGFSTTFFGGGSSALDHDHDEESEMEVESTTPPEESQVTNVVNKSMHLIAEVKDEVKASEAVEPALAELLTSALPLAGNVIPRVIVIGEQSAGKTEFIRRLICSLLKKHEGDGVLKAALLDFFHTGIGTTTRRPTTVNFIRASANDQLNISLSFQGHKDVSYGSPQYEDLMQQLTAAVSGTDVFSEDVEIKVVSGSVPNIRFTDMPGLTSTNDRSFKDSNLKVKDLVISMMEDPNNAVVVVEKASTEDFQTSLVTPLIKEIQATKRPEIFAHCMLVLTKCDQVSPSLLRNHVVPMIVKTSEQLQLFPYRHIVGVMNKGDQADYDPRWNAFQCFERTGQKERELFTIVPGSTQQLSSTTQCTIEAAFHCMDQIFFVKLHQCLVVGQERIEHQIDHIEAEMRLNLMPSPALYLSSAAPGSNTGDILQRQAAALFSKQVLIEEFCHSVENVFKQSLEAVVFKPDPNLALDRLHLHSMGSGAIDRAINTQKVFQLFKQSAATSVENIAKTLLALSAERLLTAQYSPFHRIDRFHRLCNELRDNLNCIVKRAVEDTMEKLERYLDLVYLQDEPRGKLTADRWKQLLVESRHVVITNVFLSCRGYLHELKNKFWVAIESPELLFEEDMVTVALRKELNLQRDCLLQQDDTITRCLVLFGQPMKEDKLKRILKEDSLKLQQIKHMHQGCNPANVEPPLLDCELQFWIEAHAEHVQHSAASLPRHISGIKRRYEGGGSAEIVKASGFRGSASVEDSMQATVDGELVPAASTASSKSNNAFRVKAEPPLMKKANTPSPVSVGGPFNSVLPDNSGSEVVDLMEDDDDDVM